MHLHHFSPLAFAAAVAADGAFHTAQYNTQYFTSFKGNLIVPPRVPSGGTPYVWPGLQPPNAGVLQPVLDGRDQHWYFGNAYVGANPSQPYGGGVDASVNEQLTFYMTETSTGSGNWKIGVANSAGATADYEYDVEQQMTSALFAVELYDNSWDFGNVVFKNVEIVASGSDASWCTANPQYSDVTIDFEGVTSSVADGAVKCNIASVTLSPP